MPSVAWAQSYDTNGFGSESDPYEPATLTTGKYDIDDDGIKDNVYEIGNAGQLYWFAGLVNGTLTGITQDQSANAVLTADITVNTGVFDANGNLSSNTSGFRSWTPIGGGSGSVKYTGIFDGNNKSISGLYYNVNVESSVSIFRAGFFGWNNGTIKNLSVKNSYFGLVINDSYLLFGCICGTNEGNGIIKNCNNAGTVSVSGSVSGQAIKYECVGGISGGNGTNAIIESCNNAGKVSSTGSTLSYVGGVNAYNMGKIVDCSNIGEVSGTSEGAFVGGICGRNKGGTIEYCANNGNCNGVYVGGICGVNQQSDGVVKNVVKIKYCYNRGTINGTSYAAGVCGYIDTSVTVEITNCYNTGVVSGGNVGGICGLIQSSSHAVVTNCYYLSETATDDGGKTEAQFKSGSVCYLLNGEKSEGTAESPLAWYQNINNGSIDNYPVLDRSHGTVYASAPCPSNFSNTNDLAAIEHNYVANSENPKHTCTNCGKTHDAVLTVNTDEHRISACHGGSVTLKAPTDNLTYDKTGKKATVEGALTGIATPNILYKLKGSSEAAAETAPVNAGTYIASITYTIGGVDYSVSVEYTIEKADNEPNRPNDLYGCIGEKLSTVSLKASEGWSWDNPESTLPENVENITVKASYNGADKDNYKNITSVDVTINLIPYHNYTNGFCEYCGGNEPAQLVSKDHHQELFGTHKGYYAIENAGQLYWFAGLVNGTLEGVTRNKSANAVLTDNITVNEGVLDTNGKPNSGTFRNWTPICEFDDNDIFNGYPGTFDGNNKIISGLYYDNSKKAYVGLFGSSSGTIKNVGVVDSYFNGDEEVGGVCGINNKGTIQNCYNASSVNGRTKCVGGVCGWNSPWSGSPNDKIINCYNVGAVRGTTNVGGVCGSNNNGTIINCYYLSGTTTGGINGADAAGSAEGKTAEKFRSGEVAYLLVQGCTVGETFYDGSVWGQQLGENDYPILGSPYKLITTAKKTEDGTYWATFSDQSSDVTLSVPSTRTLNVYNATVSAGTMTLTERNDDNQVAKGEGVLLKTNGEYVNVKANETGGLKEVDYAYNNLVATPETAGAVGGDDNYKLYRLTYNTIQNKDNLGFYLGVATVNGTTYKDGSYVNATPGKAYLKVKASEAKNQSTAYLARGFAFPGDGETTGIECITVTDESLHSNGNAEGIFDLQGRKVSKPTKGVYINNGKKVIIK